MDSEQGRNSIRRRGRDRGEDCFERGHSGVESLAQSSVAAISPEGHQAASANAHGATLQRSSRDSKEKNPADEKPPSSAGEESLLPIAATTTTTASEGSLLRPTREIQSCTPSQSHCCLQSLPSSLLLRPSFSRSSSAEYESTRKQISQSKRRKRGRWGWRCRRG